MSIIYIKLPAAQQPAASNIKFYADDDVFSRSLKQALLPLGGGQRLVFKFFLRKECRSGATCYFVGRLLLGEAVAELA